MKKSSRRKVISYKSLPVRFPVVPTVVALLVLDRLKAPGWIVGAVGVVLAFMWIGAFALLWQQIQTDIFPEDDKK